MSGFFRRAPVHQRIIDKFGSVEALLEGGVDPANNSASTTHIIVTEADIAPVNEFIVLAALGALFGRIRDISPFYM